MFDRRKRNRITLKLFILIISFTYTDTLKLVKMDTNGYYSMFLMWALCIMVIAVYLFTGGFLLRRPELPEKSVCHNYSSPYPDSCNLVPRQYEKAIILIIDALKYDFTLYNDSMPLALAKPYQNRLPVIHNLTKGDGRLYEFLADPPTTTMQRLKGLTTGSLPAFIDVSSNFASSEIHLPLCPKLTLHSKTIHGRTVSCDGWGLSAIW